MIRSITSSLRADRLRSDEGFGPAEATWLMVATLLEQAVLLEGSPRAELVRDAIELAEQKLGKEELTRGVTRDWGSDASDRGSYEAVLVLADHAEQGGALNLSRAMLDAMLEADESLTPVQRGRLTARCARVDGKLGLLDAAVDQYKRVGRLGMHGRNPELQALALVGLVGLAQMRGNYPQVERFAKRAARIADHAGLRSLSRHAHSGAMIAAGMRHDFVDALKHASAVYARSAGDPLEDGETLQNIGQLLLEAGHSEAAAAAFATVMSLALPARILLPALGGLAIASARVGVVERTKWAAREVQSLQNLNVPRSPLASALLECAEGLAIVRDLSGAKSCLTLALALADKHGFFEVSVKAERLSVDAFSPMPPRKPLGRSGARLAQELVSAQPAGLPERATLFVAAPV